MKRSLGVCYYPEHWPEGMWAADAARMRRVGLSRVRIGEFAWSRIEPEPGRLELGWLDRAIATLGDHGLKVVLGTPTAAPPRWMLDRHPDMLPVDRDGRQRGFGSRRHYDFSHPGYLAECERIVTILAERYGGNPHVAAWQVDNEYGCHDTTLSWSDAARSAFRDWLALRYGSVQALNQAWGNVFWSMDYRGFDDIGLPNQAVTQSNPAHWLDFRRFASDRVAAFSRAQVAAIRRHSSAPVAHNYMGGITDFDHYATGADLDIAGWDSYPLGFLSDRVPADAEHKRMFARQGDPDYQAFHHDLYRSVGRGRWWVMEQQPGPVNWAPHNPDPLPGMVRLWAWEAFAHGAETVCWFRWRQLPFGQEQHHAGLLRPDDAPAPARHEAGKVARELADAPEVPAPPPAPVAIVFDYASAWAWQALPQGAGFDYFGLVFSIYRALRRLGLNIDILPPDTASLAGRRLVLVPALATLSAPLRAALAAHDGIAMLGPRSNACTEHLAIPVPLPPAIPGLDCTVARVESLPPDLPVPLARGGAFHHWREKVEGAPVIEKTADGWPALVGDRLRYLAGWPDDAALHRILRATCAEVALPVMDLPPALRTRSDGRHRFWFNHGPEPVAHGGIGIPPAGVLREPL
ncbi:MAG: beta-galactosidase [Paracoccaceae bacterium]|nr:MAG: beta-galactosidase [Paracoccaceae bacterium]